MFEKAYLCIIAVIVILLPNMLYAQAPDTLWSRRYNGPAEGDDRAHSCAVDGGNNIYVTGGSWSGTDYDYLTIKYDASGDTLWTRWYGYLGSYDQAYGCMVDRSDNLYVTGCSSNDYLTIKYNASGDTLWTRRYHDPVNNYDIAMPALLIAQAIFM